MNPKPRRTQTLAREPRPGQLFVGIPEVALMLGKSYDWCVRSPRPAKKGGDGKSNLDILIAEYGFPLKRDFPGQPHWSRKKVQQWIDEEHDIAPLLKAGKNPDYDAILDERNRRIAEDAA